MNNIHYYDIQVHIYETDTFKLPNTTKNVISKQMIKTWFLNDVNGKYEHDLLKDSIFS